MTTPYLFPRDRERSTYALSTSRAGPKRNFVPAPLSLAYVGCGSLLGKRMHVVGKCHASSGIK